MTINLSAANEFMASHARVLDRRRFELRAGADRPLRRAGRPWRVSQRGRRLRLGARARPPLAGEPTRRRPARLRSLRGHRAGRRPAGRDPLRLAGLDHATRWRPAVCVAPKHDRRLRTLVGRGGPLRLVAADHLGNRRRRLPRRGARPGRGRARLAQRATDYCLRAIESIDRPPFAYVLAFSIDFLDAVHDSRPREAEAPTASPWQVRPRTTATSACTAAPSTSSLRPLDVAPFPDRPARSLFSDAVISADLERLAALQQNDGGWVVDYLKISPAGSLDWRGHATVRAIDILQHNRASPTATRAGHCPQLR